VKGRLKNVRTKNSGLKAKNTCSPFLLRILIVNSTAATITDRTNPTASITNTPPILAKPNSEANSFLLSSRSHFKFAASLHHLL